MYLSSMRLLRALRSSELAATASDSFIISSYSFSEWSMYLSAYR